LPGITCGRGERPASSCGSLPIRTTSGRGSVRRRAPGPGAGLVVRDVPLALRVRHLVEEHVRAVERVAADVVQRPHLLGIKVEMRLRDERLPVVADVTEVLDDLGEILTVVERLPLA